MAVHSVEMTLPNGQVISLETGKYAKQANGAVWVRSGDTIINVAATMGSSPRPGLDFFPLTCDYEVVNTRSARSPAASSSAAGVPVRNPS